MSKILFLGASAFQLAPIKYAKSVGHHTIVCDYLPDAPGHKIADEGFVTSTTDKEAVLKLAKDCHVHAVIAYASDPAAPVAAYVCDKLGLPGNPVEAVDTMTYKDKWREFQRIHDFPCPIGFGSSPYFPVIVKPVDSSGSKGVSIVHHDYEYESAVAYALTHSRKGKFVCESLVEKDGYQIAGDAFVVDGVIDHSADFSFFIAAERLAAGLRERGNKPPTRRRQCRRKAQGFESHCDVQRLFRGLVFRKPRVQ